VSVNIDNTDEVVKLVDLGEMGSFPDEPSMVSPSPMRQKYLLAILSTYFEA
jgi:hypothetical protein